MVFGESPLKDLYRLLAWGPWRWGLQAAPGPLDVRANRALGRLAYRASRGRADTVRAHVAAAVGPSDAERVAREVFATHFANQYVGPTFAKADAASWPRWLRLEGREALDEALGRGRGVVVAHPHLGLPQLPLHALGLLGYDVHQVGGGRTAVALSPLGERCAALRTSLESDIRAELHDARAYVRPLLRVLGRNGVVFTACDGTGGGDELGRREVREVLGRSMRLPSLPAWLAARSGAAVVTMACTRARRGAPYVARFEPVPEGADVLDVVARRLEGWLRESPGDWHFWDQWHDGPGGLLLAG